MPEKPNYRKICKICGTEMDLIKEPETGKWYYACPECNYTEYNQGIYFLIRIALALFIGLFLYFFL